MQFTSFTEARKSVLSGDIRLPDLVDAYIQQIHEKNDEINSVIYLDEEKARKRAEEVQKKVDNGEAGPLAGAVVGIKDVISQKDEPTQCASHILDNFEAVYDATVIEKLKEADAVFLGRMNMDEFAMGSSNENSKYGPARNPHNTDYVPGGSSGGSAASIAAGFNNMTFGSDTGGSIRQPASYCGVVGLKPTYGRVSRYGLVAYASSFDCIGPFGRTVEDVAHAMNVISGPDPHDQTAAHVDVPDYVEELNNDSGEKLKVGIAEEYFGEGLDEEIKNGIRDQLNQLDGDAFELVPIHLPNMKYTLATYYILATAEASSNLARFDGIRYGHRADLKQVQEDLQKERQQLEQEYRSADADRKAEIQEELERVDTPLIRLYKQSRTEGFGTEVKRRIMLGTYVLSAGYYDAYYAKAQKMRRLIKQDFDEAFKKVDVIASPTAPTTAFKIGDNINDPLQMYLNDIYTISANLAGICCLNVPAGTHSNGLPYGMQFMGNTFGESKILKAGLQIENLQK